MQYLANIAGNRQLYQKAYFLEFLGEDGTTVEDAFCFSVPPESEELTYTQRKTETKTFGGLHVDDYGIDAAKIVLSGSTVNQELKMIYRGEQSSKWLTGEEEIYYLRDLIKKYKTGTENLRKKILLYDLSKTGGGPGGASIIKNYWQVFLGDFKIRRSSDRPFTYKYSLELTAISLEEGEAFASHGEPPQMTQAMLDSITALLTGGGETDKTLEELEEERRQAVQNTMEAVRAAAEAALEVVTAARVIADEAREAGRTDLAEELEASAGKTEQQAEKTQETAAATEEAETVEEAEKAVTESEDTVEEVEDINTIIEYKDDIDDPEPPDGPPYIYTEEDDLDEPTRKTKRHALNARKNCNASWQAREQATYKLLDRIRNGLTAAIDFIDGINGVVNNALNEVNKVSSLLKLLGNVASYASNTLTSMVGSAGDTAAGFIDGATNIVQGTHAVASLPRNIELQALSVGLELQNATKALVRETAALVKTCRDMFDEDGAYWEVPQEVLDQYGMNNEEFKDSIALMLDQVENTANELAAAAKSSDIPDVTIGNAADDTKSGASRQQRGSASSSRQSGGGSASQQGGSGSDPLTQLSGIEPRIQLIVLSYGHTEVILKATDTLESLAKTYFGDPDRAIDIAAFNGIAALQDRTALESAGLRNTLKPGDTIKIPITTRTQRSIQNRIFARREDRDNYGRDILLDDQGCIQVSASGDYALTEGPQNLAQAILLRLRESVAKRIRLNAYGIRTAISDPAAGIAYIISSIALTVSGDPRVSAVEDIRFTGAGDALQVKVVYSDINHHSGTAEGTA